MKASTAADDVERLHLRALIVLIGVALTIGLFIRAP